jgi:hypothetical protein
MRPRKLLAPLGERCPLLAELRVRLVQRTVVTDDLPADYLRLLYGLPGNAPVFSKGDALQRSTRR